MQRGIASKKQQDIKTRENFNDMCRIGFGNLQGFRNLRFLLWIHFLELTDTTDYFI
jgi:hypothetical protein